MVPCLFGGEGGEIPKNHPPNPILNHHLLKLCIFTFSFGIFHKKTNLDIINSDPDANSLSTCNSIAILCGKFPNVLPWIGGTLIFLRLELSFVGHVNGDAVNILAEKTCRPGLVQQTQKNP